MLLKKVFPFGNQKGFVVYSDWGPEYEYKFLNERGILHD